MKNKTIIKTLASITAVLAMIPIFGGCGQVKNTETAQNSTNTTESAEEKPSITVSEAISKEHLWFYLPDTTHNYAESTDPIIGKNTPIYNVFVFQDKGKVKVYGDINGSKSGIEPLFKVSELRGKKEDEIVELIKQRDKDNQEKYIQDTKKLLSDAIQEIENMINRGEGYWSNYDSWDIEEEYYTIVDGGDRSIPGYVGGDPEDYQSLVKIGNQQIESYKKILEAYNTRKYEVPELNYGFELHSDETGNDTETEIIHFFEKDEKLEKAIKIEDGIHFTIEINNQILDRPSVYDMTFGGFGKDVGSTSVSGCFIALDKTFHHQQLMLDQPNTKAKNIIVDPEEN